MIALLIGKQYILFVFCKLEEGECKMDIDKRTGRGCAWSILSKTIARKLVDDGIVGKEIARKNFTYRCV